MKKIIPSLWFGDNNCEEAINYYVNVFPNSEIQNIVKYPDENLDEHFNGKSGKIITAEFLKPNEPDQLYKLHTRTK